MLITDFSFINDNCRATCIAFYNILIDFKIYNKKKLINIVKFHDNNIYYLLTDIRNNNKINSSNLQIIIRLIF